jgi:lipopolysaccharide transport system permease protein
VLYHWNPFTYFLEMVRTPIVLGRVPVDALSISTAIILAVWVAALLLLGKLRKQVVFML